MKEKIYGIKNILKENESILIERSKKEGFLPESYQGKENTVGLDIRINWIDVSNAEELIDAINNNPCAVTVFDLHGSHKVDGGGCIHLRNGYIHASQLVGRISVSPIVILSTCDASPVDKGHGSMAEAFFLAGAKTVISSALPINSDLASTFLARLLVRLQIYLPRALNNYPIIRWSTFFSGMIRRAYYAELVELLQKKYKFDSRSKTKLLFDIGIRIDPLNPDWVVSVNKEITGMLNIAIDELEKFITDNVQFVECMKYFQLGRPELIVIFPQNERILASSTV